MSTPAEAAAGEVAGAVSGISARGVAGAAGGGVSGAVAGIATGGVTRIYTGGISGAVAEAVAGGVFGMFAGGVAGAAAGGITEATVGGAAAGAVDKVVGPPLGPVPFMGSPIFSGFAPEGYEGFPGFVVAPSTSFAAQTVGPVLGHG
ncbi:glycine-rich cell wall structural protein-like [Andrographis paniculata]|uniref:glycine-rich cell wall structural protein-like n=1 Tax=Andrographis paniculata TaxID=175694 RepID=UPI0021E70682|nr:glycine-rich cell wall structural protein-like [Andrographis paniculata]